MSQATADARYPLATEIREIVVVTQAEYDGLTPVATTAYWIVG
jgi:hypothetical protein